MDAMTAAVLGLLLVVEGRPGPESHDIKPEHVEQLVNQLGAREPFLKSGEAKDEPGSLYHYFQKADYEALRGNPVVGYWDEGGFRWSGTTVAWGGIAAGASSAERIKPRAWEAAFRYVAQRRGFVVDERAQLRVEGRCVAAAIDATAAEPVPGVLLEVRVHSPSGVLRHRFSVGKPTVEEAMGAALDFLLSFSKSIGTGGGKK